MPGYQRWVLPAEEREGTAHERGREEQGALHAQPTQRSERSGQGLAFEQVNAPRVMSPWEIRSHVPFIAEHAVPDPALGKVFKRIDRFVDAWAAAWARFGIADEGLPTYGELIATTRRDLNALGGRHLVLRNELELYHVLDQLVFSMAAAPPPVTSLRAAAVGEQRLAS